MHPARHPRRSRVPGEGDGAAGEDSVVAHGALLPRLDLGRPVGIACATLAPPSPARDVRREHQLAVRLDLIARGAVVFDALRPPRVAAAWGRPLRDAPVGNSPRIPGITSSGGEALADPELEVFLASEDLFRVESPRNTTKKTKLCKSENVGPLHKITQTISFQIHCIVPCIYCYI